MTGRISLSSGSTAKPYILMFQDADEGPPVPFLSCPNDARAGVLSCGHHLQSPCNHLDAHVTDHHTQVKDWHTDLYCCSQQVMLVRQGVQHLPNSLLMATLFLQRHGRIFAVADTISLPYMIVLQIPGQSVMVTNACAKRKSKLTVITFKSRQMDFVSHCRNTACLAYSLECWQHLV